MSNVDKITVESDERGFELHVWVDEDPTVDERGLMVLNIHSVALDLRKAVHEQIDPWWAEGEQVLTEFKRRAFGAAFACDPDESAGMAEAYALDDPKHPDYHDAMADLWDSRDGK